MSFKIKDIIEAWTKEEPIHEEWFQERLRICAECPLNSLNKEKKTFVEKTREALGGVFKEAYCTACGCTITKKASLKRSVCGAVEQRLPPKWNALEQDVTKNNENIKVRHVDGYKYSFDYTDRTEVDLGQTDKNLVEFEIDLVRKPNLQFLKVDPTCGCTVPTYTDIGDNTNRLKVKISTVNFTKGKETKKSIIVTYLDTKTKFEQQYPIRCKIQRN